MSPKNPVRPKGPLSQPEIRLYDGALMRIHTPSPAHGHASQWNTFRHFGPLRVMRWDPHPPGPPATHGAGVLYAGCTSDAAFAEVFQDAGPGKTGLITLSSERHLSIWETPPATPLRLLDLTTDWPVQNGASASLPDAAKHITRNWAHEIRLQYGAGIDGLIARSSVCGDDTVALFENAASRLPRDPMSSLPLTHSAVKALALAAGRRFKWPVMIA